MPLALPPITVPDNRPLAQVTLAFNELQLFPRAFALASGSATISYADEDDWHVAEIELDGEYRFSPKRPLPRTDMLWPLMIRALETEMAADIARRIAEDMTEPSFDDLRDLVAGE